MKDIVVLFYYLKMFPMTVGGDESWYAVGLDCSDGSAFELFFYDDDDGPCINEFADILKPLTYNDVRELAQIGCKNGLVDDPSIYDALSQSSWRDYLRKLPLNARHIITDDSSENRILPS